MEDWHGMDRFPNTPRKAGPWQQAVGSERSGVELPWGQLSPQSAFLHCPLFSSRTSFSPTLEPEIPALELGLAAPETCDLDYAHLSPKPGFPGML